MLNSSYNIIPQSFINIKSVKLIIIIKLVRLLIITINPIIKFINIPNDRININIIIRRTNENIRLSCVFNIVFTIVNIKSTLI